jgi:mRNA interferase MazF
LAAFEAGQIVIADWRDAIPREPNKPRPAVVIEDADLFDPLYPAVILVPLSDRADFVIPSLAVAIEPTPENGCSKRCWAISHFVTATSVARITGTQSRVTAAQLAHIRRQVAEAIGLR